MNQRYTLVAAAVAELLLSLLAPLVPAIVGGRPLYFDGLIRDILREVGLRVAQGLAEMVAAAIVARARVFGFRIEHGKTIDFLTLFGSVSVKSPYMVNVNNGETDRPVNRVLHVHGRGMTPMLTRVVTDFGIDLSGNRAAAKLLEHYGIELNRCTILRVVKREGERAQRHIDDVLVSAPMLPDAQASVEVMLAEMDGCEARTGRLVPIEGSTELTPVRKLPKRRRETDWRDVRVGLVRPLDSESEPKSYVSSLDSYDTLADNLAALAVLRGAGRGTEFVKVVDGANGLREAMDRKLPGQTILDKPHCRSHLFATAKAMIDSETSSDRREPLTGPLSEATAHQAGSNAHSVPTAGQHARVNRWTAMMAAGNVGDVLIELESWRPQGWTATDEVSLHAPRALKNTPKLEHPGMDRVRQLTAHLRRFHDAVHYDAYHEARYPLGDGEVESAHRIIPQPRLKLPGTWWLPETIDAIAALRVVRENGWWEDFWPSSRPVALAQ